MNNSLIIQEKSTEKSNILFSTSIDWCDGTEFDEMYMWGSRFYYPSLYRKINKCLFFIIQMTWIFGLLSNVLILHGKALMSSGWEKKR